MQREKDQKDINGLYCLLQKLINAGKPILESFSYPTHFRTICMCAYECMKPSNVLGEALWTDTSAHGF